MPRETVEVVGTKYGRLTLVARVRAGLWRARCDCGIERDFNMQDLRSGNTSSCGCLRVDLVRLIKATHGDSRSPEWETWKRMTQRCYNDRHPNFKDYGGRGIVICERWRGPEGFINFLADMGRRPASKHSIDRFPDKNGNYELSNCRWATQQQQAENTRRNRWLTLNGVTMLLRDWVTSTGISQSLISMRINKLGWSVERALTTPPRKMK